MPARDAEGCLRILDPGLMPFPKDVMEIHEEKLRRRASRDGVAFGHGLAVASVYELSEPVVKLMNDRWLHPEDAPDKECIPRGEIR